MRETLEFQALVRMERQIPRKQRMARVDAVLQELGLTKCEDTLIGIPGRMKVKKQTRSFGPAWVLLPP